MKRYSLLLCIFALAVALFGCKTEPTTQVVATTLPVYEFTAALCQRTNIRVTRLLDQNISCLHDYTLQISQMQAIESAELLIISGAGLEDSLGNMIPAGKTVLDASTGIELLDSGDGHHQEDGHTHEKDPHIWLDPENARHMAKNIAKGLSEQYPEHTALISDNLAKLEKQLDELSTYAQVQLQNLLNRDLVTFHDGFSYMAHAFDLQVLHAVEEESGSEASAAELIALIQIVNDHNLPAIFTEVNGSTAAATIISAETDIPVYSLDMAMSGDSYFSAMKSNIDTLKEALE